MSNLKFQSPSLGTNLKFLTICYILVIVYLFFYSFTQVDLGLTLTEWSIWQVYQAFFQQIGYFQRPLSTALYLFLLSGLFVFYIIFLILAKKNQITKKQLFTIIGIAGVILLFSYNAFSYDLFNYIFDAKIVTHYQQNPYEHRALDYFGEPMLGFMRWTHRLYPYGPTWLALTIPLSFVGFGYFLFTLMLFKFLAFASYLGSVFYLNKILKKVSPEHGLFGVAFFALNPLVLIESLVSAHNDIVMMFFAIFAFYLLISKKYIFAFLLLFFSIGIKFATVFLLPIFIFVLIQDLRKKQINFENIWLISILGMITAIILAIFRTELQPWYLLHTVPFIALLKKQRIFLFLTITLSLGLLLHYVPFLYTGNWDPPIPTIKIWITGVSLLFGILIFLLSFINKKNSV